MKLGYSKYKKYDEIEEFGSVKERNVRKKRGKVVDSDGFENDDFDINRRKQKTNPKKCVKFKKSNKKRSEK